MKSPTLYGPFIQLLTLNKIPMHGPLSDTQLTVSEIQGIVVEKGRIIEIDEYDKLTEKYPHAHRRLSAAKNVVALPAFVDCHTHICWSGSRVNDYAMRVAGRSYLDIARAGGGIMETVRALREATPEELTEGILKRAVEHIRRGIATIEVKSGYGLSLKDEINMLECIKVANEHTPATLIPTFLGAHIKPKDFKGTHAEYLDFLVREVVPEIQKKDLASRADIFVEEGAFGLKEAALYSGQLQNLGFDMTMHVDQFHPGGSLTAIESGCVSADHLEYIDDKGINAFAESETVAVALPGASIGLGMNFTPVRSLLDKGACVAVASDWNPGSAPMGDLLTQASILGTFEKMTIAETLAGITTRAAKALRTNDGSIQKGEKAKFIVFETDDFRNIFYRQGQLKPLCTIIGEECISNEAFIS